MKKLYTMVLAAAPVSYTHLVKMELLQMTRLGFSTLCQPSLVVESNIQTIREGWQGVYDQDVYNNQKFQTDFWAITDEMCIRDSNMNGAFEIEADVTPDANGIAGIEISNNKRCLLYTSRCV